MDLEGKAALVTGASRGLGGALARELGRRGARVGLVARGREALEYVAAEVRAAGGTAHVLLADISDKNAVYPLAGAAAAVLGPIDVLVHNASQLGPTPLRLLLDTDCEDLDAVLAANVVGPFRLTKIVAGPMALPGAGTILLISSDSTLHAYPRCAPYSLSNP